MNRANLLLTELLAMLLDDTETKGPKTDSFAESKEFTAFPVFRPENS